MDGMDGMIEVSFLAPLAATAAGLISAVHVCCLVWLLVSRSIDVRTCMHA